jgi:hypothetical protein
MKALDIKITRKWIKNLRKKGLTNAEIISAAISKADLLSDEGDTAGCSAVYEDLRLAGLIAGEN